MCHYCELGVPQTKSVWNSKVERHTENDNTLPYTSEALSEAPYILYSHYEFQVPKKRLETHEFRVPKKRLETHYEFRTPPKKDSKLIMSFEYQKKEIESQNEVDTTHPAKK